LLDASVAAHEEARRLDPTIQTSVVNTFHMLCDFERIARDTDPSGDPDSRSLALFRLGRTEEALAALSQPPPDAPPFVREWIEMIRACYTNAPGSREIAERVIAGTSWTDPEGHMTGAIVLSRLGSEELALKMLREAVDGGFYVPYTLLNDPWLAPLRSQARFAEIVRLAQARHDEARAVFRAEGGERLLGLPAAA
jgi:hypothetical protein